MKVPWGFYSLTNPPLEHYQDLDDDPGNPSGQIEEGGEEGGVEEEPEYPNRLPYPPFWETDPDQF